MEIGRKVYERSLRRDQSLTMRRTKLASLAAVSTIALSPIALSSAIAAPPILDAEGSSSHIQTSSEEGSSEDGKDDKFSATFEILDKNDEIETFHIDDPEITITDFMDSRGLDPEDYNIIDSKNTDGNRKFEKGETVTVLKDSRTTSAKEIPLKRKEERVETDTLFVGEEKVESEGKDGKAIEVAIFEYSVNDNGDIVKNNTEKKLTVIESPEPKKILVGTKERLSEPVERAELEDSDSGSAKADSTGSVSPVSENSVEGSLTQSEHSPEVENRMNSTFTYNGVERSTGDTILEIGRSQIGARYVYGSLRPGVSFDCSGLTSWAYSRIGISIPRTASAQKAAGKVIPKSEAQPGDLVYWPGHVGIYAGGNMVVDAGNSSKGVSERNIWGNPVFVTFR